MKVTGKNFTSAMMHNGLILETDQAFLLQDIAKGCHSFIDCRIINPIMRHETEAPRAGCAHQYSMTLSID